MDPSNPFAVFLRPELVALLTLQPLIVQILKGNFSFLTGSLVAVLSFVVAVVMVVWNQIHVATPVGWQAWLELAGMAVIAWFYTEVLYQKIVAPMAANKSQPLVPSSKQ